MVPRFSPTWLALAVLLSALPAAGQVTVVAAGDIACDPADAGYNGGAGTAARCRMLATSNVALGLSPAAVLLLGDLQYENGALAKFQASFDPSWGRLKAVSRPVPGNHEYATANAQGYFDYFGVRNYGSFGILELKLHPKGYEWRFLSDAGDLGAVLDSGHGLCHSALPAPSADFHTVPPCRLADTRPSSPLTAGSPAAFPAAGSCGIPSDAVAAVVNVTVVEPTASGNLQVYPSGLSSPQSSVVNFPAGTNRGSLAILPLGLKGELDARVSAGTADVVLDVTGYFR